MAQPSPWSSEADSLSSLDNPLKRLRASDSSSSNKGKRSNVSNSSAGPLAQIGLNDGHFDTLASLHDGLEMAIQRQIEHASYNQTPPGAPVEGDRIVRNIAYTFLPNSLLRTIFMSTMRSTDAYRRATSLFGAPPYHFLHPGDAGMLNAQGFSQGRRNMAYDNNVGIANYVQFGVPQFADRFGRQYGVKHGDGTPSGLSPPMLISITMGNTTEFIMVVRLPKCSKERRQAMMRTPDGRRSLSMPRPGEQLEMRVVPEIYAFLPPRLQDNLKEHSEVNARVLSIRTPDRLSSTAILQVRKV